MIQVVPEHLTWPGAMTLIGLAFIGALPNTIAAIVAAVKTIRSNNKVETKVEQQAGEVGAVKQLIGHSNDKLDQAAEKREVVNQKLDAANSAAQEFLNIARWEKHRDAQQEQIKVLEDHLAEQATRLAKLEQRNPMPQSIPK